MEYQKPDFINSYMGAERMSAGDCALQEKHTQKKKVHEQFSGSTNGLWKFVLRKEQQDTKLCMRTIFISIKKSKKFEQHQNSYY